MEATLSTLIIIAAWAVILIGGWQACRDAAALLDNRRDDSARWPE